MRMKEGELMWTREELKQNAKNTLRDKYWTILGVSVLAGILQGSFLPSLQNWSIQLILI